MKRVLLALLLTSCTDTTTQKYSEDQYAPRSLLIIDAEVDASPADAQLIRVWDAQIDSSPLDQGDPSECGFGESRDCIIAEILLGECAKGIQVCSLGEWAQCTPLRGSRIEECDGLDNDCDGSVDAQVSANPAAGFSVVTYSGSGNRTIGHGLNKAPEMIIMKGRNVTDQWTVGHHHLNGGSSPWNYGTPLNSTTNIQTNSTFWNNTAPTDTVFTRGSWDAGYNMVSYCFHSVEGFSKFSSSFGNGNAEGPFVYCGFRPAFVLTKMVDTMGENWTISDSSRSTFNPVDLFLRPDETTMDSSGAATMDFCAEGFKLRNTDDKTNRDGARFIFMAFAEQSPVTQYDVFTNAR